MYNDTHLNVLISYAYLYNQQPFIDFVKEQSSRGKEKSGASKNH